MMTITKDRISRLTRTAMDRRIAVQNAVGSEWETYEGLAERTGLERKEVAAAVISLRRMGYVDAREGMARRRSG